MKLALNQSFKQRTISNVLPFMALRCEDIVCFPWLKTLSGSEDIAGMERRSIANKDSYLVWSVELVIADHGSPAKSGIQTPQQ